MGREMGGRKRDGETYKEREQDGEKRIETEMGTEMGGGERWGDRERQMGGRKTDWETWRETDGEKRSE